MPLSSRQDYCTALFIPGSSLQTLQSIENSSARMMRVWGYQHITPFLTSHHQLPISYMIQLKTFVLSNAFITQHLLPLKNKSHHITLITASGQDSFPLRPQQQIWCCLVTGPSAPPPPVVDLCLNI